MKQGKETEMFFKQLAELYAESQAGDADDLHIKQTNYPQSLDKRVYKTIGRLKKKRLGLFFFPIAASLIVVAIAFKWLPLFTNINQTAPQIAQKPIAQDVVLLAHKLPQGYAISNIEEDNGQTIYHIENDKKNTIIVTTKAAAPNLEAAQMETTTVNGQTIYVNLTKDYGFLSFEKDNMYYTLTSPYGDKDLFTLAEKII